MTYGFLSNNFARTVLGFQLLYKLKSNEKSIPLSPAESHDFKVCLLIFPHSISVLIIEPDTIRGFLRS